MIVTHFDSVQIVFLISTGFLKSVLPFYTIYCLYFLMINPDERIEISTRLKFIGTIPGSEKVGSWESYIMSTDPSDTSMVAP